VRSVKFSRFVPRPRATSVRWLALLAVPLLMLGALSIPAATATNVSATPESTLSANSPISDAGLPTQISHVIVVMEENHDLAWALTDPGFDSLYLLHAHATHEYSVCHPSAPNYLALTDALKQQCGSDAVSYYSSSNLASDLSQHGKTWQGLFESMPRACDRSNSGLYAARHNPWVFYSNLKSQCASQDLPFFTASGASALQQELNAKTLPSFTFIAPNLDHDASGGSLSDSSSWLHQNVISPVESSAFYWPDTVVFVTFDEGYLQSCDCEDHSGYSADGMTFNGGWIYLVAVSPISPDTLVVSNDVTEFNVASTIEWLLGIPSLGHNDDSHFPPIKGLFR